MHAAHKKGGGRAVRDNPVASPMAHFWFGLDQPSIGEAILLVRETFGLTRGQLIDRMSHLSGGTDLGPDESVVFRWERGRAGRNRSRPSYRRRFLLSKVCEEAIRTVELAHLAGWMAYDVGHHGQARDYLQQALRMAMTARDDGFSAEVLAAMSHQAIHLNQPGEAIDLARAAQATAARTSLPSLIAE